MTPVRTLQSDVKFGDCDNNNTGLRVVASRFLFIQQQRTGVTGLALLRCPLPAPDSP